MSKKMKRRDFMITSAGAGLVVAANKTRASSVGPIMLIPAAVKPVVVSSANGNRFKNGGNITAVHKAFNMITKGEDVLDSLIAGVNIVELDPLDDSVGYGGLPNAEGVVQLDSSCMHGPRKRAGAVGALEGVRTPSLVAQSVMDNTDHHLIVGKGAQDGIVAFGDNGGHVEGSANGGIAGFRNLGFAADGGAGLMVGGIEASKGEKS